MNKLILAVLFAIVVLLLFSKFTVFSGGVATGALGYYFINRLLKRSKRND